MITKSFSHFDVLLQRATGFGLIVACLLTLPICAQEEGAANSNRGTTTPDEQVSIEKIIAAWKRHEQQVQSAVFEWTEHRIHTQSILGKGEWMAEPDDPEYDVPSRLSFAGNRLRYTFKKSKWVEETPEGGDEYVGVFDGTISKIYLPPGYVAQYPRGHLSKQAHSESLVQFYLKPLLLAYRIFEPNASLFSLDQLQISPERGLWKGRECLILTHRDSPTRHSKVWVDPGRDFMIVRYSSYNNESLTTQIDLTYRHDAKSNVHIPEMWKLVTQDLEEKPKMSVVGHLTRYDINPELPDEEFQYEFPIGTWVHEGNNHEYIKKGGGVQREIPVSERMLPYKTLLLGNMPQEIALGFDLRKWVLWINIAIAITASLTIFRVYMRHRKTVNGDI